MLRAPLVGTQKSDWAGGSLAGCLSLGKAQEKYLAKLPVSRRPNIAAVGGGRWVVVGWVVGGGRKGSEGK